MELEDTHKPDQEILILNHSQIETIGYPLVLLEGLISNYNMNPVGPRRILSSEKSESESERGNKLQILDSASTMARNITKVRVHGDQWTLQIKTGNHEMTWPIVNGGFKVVVPLTTGENLVGLKVMDRVDIHELELKLTYEPLTISR